MYCVYKHTSPKGLVYIGLTSRNPISRWQNGTGYKGNSYFTRAIKKYGWVNFAHEIVADGLTEDEAKLLEIDLIKQYRSNERKYGYNISSGGESKKGTKISEQQKRKISEANKNKVVSEETRKKLSASTRRTWQNPEFVRYMSEINKGKNNPAYGKHMTDEEKIKRNSKQVVQYDKNGNEIARFISIHKAQELTGVSRDVISKCCRGIYKQGGGYVWKRA